MQTRSRRYWSHVRPPFALSAPPAVRPALRLSIASTAIGSRPSMSTTSAAPCVSACSQARSLATMPGIGHARRDQRLHALRDRAGESSCRLRRARRPCPPAMTSRAHGEAACEMRRERVGVHVEQAALRAHADTGDDRHVAVAAEIDEQSRPALTDRLAHAVRDPPCSPSTVTCGAARSASASPASAPVRPTALPPAALIAATNRVFTLPARTLTTTSSVSASVTRRPSTWCFAMPGACSARVDLLAAAVHDGQRQQRGHARDHGRERREAAPRPRAVRRRPSGSASRGATSQRAPCARRSRSATLKFCTACPAAPLSRLSMTETTTRRPSASSSAQPMSQKFVYATCLITGSVVPVMRTKRAPA